MNHLMLTILALIIFSSCGYRGDFYLAGKLVAISPTKYKCIIVRLENFKSSDSIHVSSVEQKKLLPYLGKEVSLSYKYYGANQPTECQKQTIKYIKQK